MFSSISHYFARNKTRNQLNRLSDRELRDIGINRCDIERIALTS